jgi:hypothetical protein
VTGEALMGHLAGGDVKEASQTLRGWYRQSEDKGPKPCYDTLEKQTREREKLDARVPPPGDPIPSNVVRPPMDDSHPADQELR